MRFAASVLSHRRPRTAAGSGTARRALAVPAAAVLLVLLATPAAAVPIGPAAMPAPAAGDTAESATAAARPPATSTPHCALAAGAGQPLHCFATFAEAVALATGGRVTDAPASAAAAAVDPAFAAEIAAAGTAAGTAAGSTAGTVLPATSTLVGVEYANANFGGATLSLFAAGRCDDSADVDYRFPSLPSGWNDRITSFKSFSNCAQQLFRSINFTGGALTLIVSSLANVGAAANDQASSITFN